MKQYNKKYFYVYGRRLTVAAAVCFHSFVYGQVYTDDIEAAPEYGMLIQAIDTLIVGSDTTYLGSWVDLINVVGIDNDTSSTNELANISYGFFLPPGTMGKKGDFWVNANTGDMYIKSTNNQWTILFANQEISIDSTGRTFTISLENGGSVTFVDNVDDADNDPSNELQTLSVDADSIYLSSDGAISLSDINYWSKPNVNTLQYGGNVKMAGAGFSVDIGGASSLRRFNVKAAGLDGRLSIQGETRADFPGIEITNDNNANRILLRLEPVGLDGNALQIFTEPVGGALTNFWTFAADGNLVSNNSKRITGLANPINGQDAVTKAYLQLYDASQWSTYPAIQSVNFANNSIQSVNNISASTGLFGGAAALRSFNVYGSGLNGRLSIQGATRADFPGIELTNDANSNRVLLRLESQGTTGNNLQIFTEPDGGVLTNFWTFRDNGTLQFNNSTKITGLANPTSSQDAATKAYVDANSSPWTVGTQGRIWYQGVGSLPYVGINTTSPTHDLDVNGSTRLRGSIIDGNNSGGQNGQILTDGSGEVEWEWGAINLSLNPITNVLSANLNLNSTSSTGVGVVLPDPEQHVGRMSAGSQTVSGTSYIEINTLTPVNTAGDISADATQNRFTVTKAGWYKIGLSGHVNWSSGEDINIRVYKNGAYLVGYEYPITVEGVTENYTIEDVVELSVNDYIEWYAAKNINEGGAFTISGRMTIERL